jgi:hypothetical protein
MAESPPATGRVFMSYRREETAYAAGWLFDQLVEHLGAGQVFKDVDSIELGDDFVDAIDTAVGSCDVLLALIGNQWLTITDEGGNRRLDDPSDFVHLEIEAALTRGVRVIPILVEGARMPRADELPPTLARLVRRQALELSPSRFEFDTSRLLRVLDKTLAEVRTRQAVADSASAPPIEAAGPIGTGPRRGPGPEVESATHTRPPPSASASDDSTGLAAAKQRVRSIWASRAGRLTLAAALIALVAILIIVVLSDGEFAGSAADIAALKSATPRSAQPCRPDSDPYLVRDAEALAQVACDGAGEGASLVYGLYADETKAEAAADGAASYERDEEHAKGCSDPIAKEVTDHSPGAGHCQVSEDGKTMEIIWTNGKVLGVVNFYRPDIPDDVAVETWKRMR